jgi:hypothetical protein
MAKRFRCESDAGVRHRHITRTKRDTGLTRLTEAETSPYAGFRVAMSGVPSDETQLAIHPCCTSARVWAGTPGLVCQRVGPEDPGNLFMTSLRPCEHVPS